MEFLWLQDIPASRVYVWSSNDGNDVGSEYIVMEKIEGIAMSEMWPK